MIAYRRIPDSITPGDMNLPTEDVGATRDCSWYLWCSGHRKQPLADPLRADQSRAARRDDARSSWLWTSSKSLSSLFDHESAMQVHAISAPASKTKRVSMLSDGGLDAEANEFLDLDLADWEDEPRLSTVCEGRESVDSAKPDNWIPEPNNRRISTVDKATLHEEAGKLVGLHIPETQSRTVAENKDTQYELDVVAMHDGEALTD